MAVAALAACSSPPPPQVEAPSPTPTPVVVEKTTPPSPTATTRPHVDASVLEALPRPRIDLLLPSGLGQAQPEDLTGEAATPVLDLTAAWASPDDPAPVLALELRTDVLEETIEARWTVVGHEPSWVRVLVPTGRGALPSQDPAAVNHAAVWVLAEDVTIEHEPVSIVVSTGERLLSVRHGSDVVAQFHVGVGVIPATPTPHGVCSMVGHVWTTANVPALLLSCQSETLDGFAGVNYAATAIHHGGGFNAATGGAVSNGCVRVVPADYDAHLADVPIGAPVNITD